MLPCVGQLPTTETTLFTVSTQQHARLKWLQLITVSSATVQVWVTVGGRRVALTPPLQLDGNSLVSVLEGTELLLDSNASISGKSTATDTDFLIAGDEFRNEGN